MPHIPNHIVHCSFYLYASEEDANKAVRSGGSGFLIHVPSPVKDHGYMYAVTNQHVIDDGFSVLRINRKQGKAKPITTEPTDWVSHPLGDDLAVFDLSLKDDLQFWSVSTDLFITPEIIDAYRIGYGDEAFLVGRLIAHSGKQRNEPVVRFGNISLMANPNEPVTQKVWNTGSRREQEAFLVECRSISGFSGSPVFATTSQTYRGEDAQKLVAFRQKEMGYDPSKQETGGPRFTTVAMDVTNAGPWLIGIDVGHLPHMSPVFEENNRETKMWVETNTGIAVVIPSWRIMQVLNIPKLVKLREKANQKRAAKAKS